MTRGGPQIIPRPPDARHGRHAPWAHLDLDGLDLGLDRARALLASRGPGRRRPGWRPPETSRRSAVLVPLYEVDGRLEMVLTRRSPHLRSHRHEVAFPGGRADRDDTSPWHTATREAHEEVALDPGRVEPIGELDPFVTVGSQSLVQPLVGALASRPDLVANPDEVERILYVPVDELLAPETFREELWPLGGDWRPITFFELPGDTVWGATGAMVRQLLAILTGVGEG